MHVVILLLSLSMIGFGVFKAATISPLLLKCDQTVCSLSDGRAWPRSSLSGRVELGLARGKGCALCS
jgi:hypothetical protein